MAAAKEFNIGTSTLIDFLVSRNFNVDELKPSSKLTEEMYLVLQAEFQQDKMVKQKAEQIDLPKGAGEVKKKKDEEDLSIQKKPEKTTKTKEKAAKEKVEEKAPETVEPPVSEAPAQPEVVEPVIETPAIAAPKVVDKIDLSTIDSSTRPKKTAKKSATKKEKEATPVDSAKEETVQPEATAAAPVAEPPVESENKPEETHVENIQAEKISGPKIVGKIELPAESDTRPRKKEDDKKRRKRIPIEKKGSESGVSGAAARASRPIADPRDRRRGGTGNRTGRGDNRNKQQDKIIDSREIEEKIKQTQAKLAGTGGRGKSVKAKIRRARREELSEQKELDQNESNKLQVTEYISVSELASLMNVDFSEVISKCMELGIMVSINQRLEADVIELVAGEFGYDIEFVGVEDTAEEEDIEDNPEDLVPRPPIVTIMGHVDHGKTSLLDYIRNTNVIAGEAGGITQHIGAYEVKTKDGRGITFLDTPGHEAFTAMRARGAKITDIAVIVIAADDAVMPQTKEAISHSQAAGVPMIFAINKIDKEGANPEKIKEQLAAMNILVESWGGKFQSQEISAKKGLNVDLLLEKILLETDLLELKANPKRHAVGSIIEASLDKGRGYVAKVLVQNGTLKVGDMIVSGQYFGKVKAMYNERNQRMAKAGPSTPVLILGLNGAPQAGETFKVYENESDARATANKLGQLLREQGIRARKHITLDEIGRRLALGNFKELNVIIKGDADGSVEALSDSLQKLSTEEIVVKVIHKGVGAITESDVTLAHASDAIIIGFNVRPTLQANRLAQSESIEIKTYSIIYNAIEEIKSAMEGMLEPSVEDRIVANVEIRETYKFDKATVAGCFVLDGKISRNNKIRLVRDGIVIFTGELGSLKRYKDDVKEVASNMECGLTIKGYNDIKTGDIVEAFEETEVKRTL